MNETARKQQYGRAYVLALAAHAGMNHATPDNDYGVDGQFRNVYYDAARKRYMDDTCIIDYQLKSTVDYKIENGILKYDLEVKNYKDLILDRLMPMILVLYIMPREEQEWLSVDCDATVLKHCAYWCSLRGKPDTHNEYKIQISIPEDQILTPETLKKLMEKAKRGELL